jgi:hypothetical protein
MDLCFQESLSSVRTLHEEAAFETNPELDFTNLHEWQTLTYGKHRAKNVNLGTHMILYTDQPLTDM